MRCQQAGFRKVLRLTARLQSAYSILAPARAAGFPAAGIVDPRLLAPWAERLSGLRSSGFLDHERFDGLEWGWILEPERWAPHAAVLVCCLPCAPGGPDDLSSPGDPHTLIAPFARTHYYRTAVRLLGDAARRIEGDLGLEHGAVRPFSNSRIPEKPLLAASGLAAYGRNGLAIAPGLGSHFVIAGAVIPVADLRVRFGEGLSPTGEGTSIIVLQVRYDQDDITIGVLADSVREVIDLDPARIERPPRIGSRIEASFVRGIGENSGEFIVVLDVDEAFRAAAEGRGAEVR